MSNPPHNNQKEKMTDAQLVESYTNLSKQLYTQHHDRRSLEWQIHIALWTLLVLLAYFLVSSDRHLGNLIYWIFLVIPIHFIWIIKIVRGVILEQDLSIKYRLQAEKILSRYLEIKAINIPDREEHSEMPKWMKKLFKSYFWWPFVQIGTTFLICCAMVILAY